MTTGSTPGRVTLRREPGFGRWFLESHAGIPVAIFVGTAITKDFGKGAITEANARHIERTWNAYDDLVGACEEAIRYLTGQHERMCRSEGTLSCCALGPTIYGLKQALRSAEGVTP